MRRFIIKITAPGEAIELQDIDARAEVLRQELGDLEGARAKVRGA
jgi:hypothetical protein